MSTLFANTYDYAVEVTKSDTVDDAAGPFSGLYVSVGGSLTCWNRNGPQGAAQPITVIVVAGTYIRWPVRRVSLSTTATVFGLVSSIIPQGS